MPDPIADAIARGSAALARLQAPDGSFPLRTRLDVPWWRRGSRWRPCGPLFATAYILLCAGRLLPAASVARALDYLRRQRRPDRLWDYDPAIGIPPDVDTAACALAALALHGAEASDLEGGAALLRGFWRPAEGPFRSWQAGGMWSLPERDDPVVNCNVLYALRLLGSPPTAAESGAVRRLLARSREGSRYYCAPSTIAHAARRAGLEPAALPAIARARPAPGDLAAVAQWLCGLPPGDAALRRALLDAQRRDGSWPAAPWVQAVGQPRPLWGSSAVTTALALEALAPAGRP